MNQHHTLDRATVNGGTSATESDLRRRNESKGEENISTPRSGVREVEVKIWKE